MYKRSPDTTVHGRSQASILFCAFEADEINW